MADKLYLDIGLSYTHPAHPSHSATMSLTELQEKAFASAHRRQRKMGDDDGRHAFEGGDRYKDWAVADM